MPKPKRRAPIVPIPKVAKGKHGAGKPKKNTNEHASNQPEGRAGTGPRIGRTQPGGGHNKRPRESTAVDNAEQSVKRRKESNESGSWRARGGSAPGRGTGEWRPLSVVHQQAAFAVQRLLEADSSRKHGVSLKSLTLAPHVVAKKATYAVTCQVLKFSRVLEQLDQQVQLSASQPKLSKYVAMVLAYELLRGQGLERKAQAERAVLAAESKLRAALGAMLQQAGVQSLDELLAAQQQQDGGGAGAGPEVPHPRWVRVNTLKASVEDVVRQLEEHLRTTTGAGGKSSNSAAPRDGGSPHGAVATQQQRQQQQQGVVRDPLLPDLLALPPGTDLHDHPLVAHGSVVLQSKASCMPAHALSPAAGWTVVDCCAAPGNKTTHVAAVMANKGRVFAFDKDPRRLARLKANAALTGASCIEARLADFLSLDPTAPEYAKVRGVLLDPSCSGSGTTFTRMDHLLPSHTASRPSVAAPAAAAAAAVAGPASAGGVTAGKAATGPTGAAAAGAAGAETQHGPNEGGNDGQPGQGKGRKKQHTLKQEQKQDVEKQPEEEPVRHRNEGHEEHNGHDAAGLGDPGAGPVDRDSGLDPDEAARVAQLARFQAAALAHALRFPSLERLVYSTCSVHVAENEAVVAGALDAAAAAGMELVDPFPSWHRRGLPLFPGAEMLVRTDAYQDGTDGFFVAVFARRQPARGGGGSGGGTPEDEDEDAGPASSGDGGGSGDGDGDASEPLQQMEPPVVRLKGMQLVGGSSHAVGRSSHAGRGGEDGGDGGPRMGKRAPGGARKSGKPVTESERWQTDPSTAPPKRRRAAG